MGKKSWAAGLGIAVSAVFATGLSAGSVQFFLGGSGDDGFVDSQTVTSNINNGPYTLGQQFQLGTAWTGTQDGVTVTVRPGGYTNGATGTSGDYTLGSQTYTGTYLGANPQDQTGRLTQTAGGLGLMNNTGAFTDDEPYHVDGSSGGSYGTGWYDFLEVGVSREVTFDFATFSDFTAGFDNFRLILDANGDGVLGNAGDFVTGPLSTAVGSTFDFPSFASSLIGLAAFSSNSSWKLRELGLSWEDPTDPTDPGTPPIAPVPLPAAGLLLVAGLGGLAALSRRRKG